MGSNRRIRLHNCTERYKRQQWYKIWQLAELAVCLLNRQSLEMIHEDLEAHVIREYDIPAVRGRIIRIICN